MQPCVLPINFESMRSTPNCQVCTNMKVLKDVEPDEWELASMIRNQAMARESRFYAVDTSTGKARLAANRKAFGAVQ